MEFFKKKKPRRPDADDFIALRDYVSAERLLKSQLRDQPDPQLHMKLGDVLRHQGLGDSAVAEYVAASDQFLAKGFTDRARAALSRAEKIAAQRPEIVTRIERMERRKRMDMVRSRALEALGKPIGDDNDAEPGPSQMALDSMWEQLSQCEWIHGLPNRQLVRVLRGMQIRHFEAGKRIVAEGSLDSTMLLITDGEVEVRRIGPRGMIALRNFQAGDLLGEKNLLEGTAWTVSLIATTDCTLLWLERAGFELALTGNQDPRGLIDALRDQHNDDEILRLVNRL